MTRYETTIEALDEPITSDWTIRELLEWLADDDRQHEPGLRDRLALIESAATGSGWTRRPSTTALIRSLADATRAQPALLSTPIGALGRDALDDGAHDRGAHEGNVHDGRRVSRVGRA